MAWILEVLEIEKFIIALDTRHAFKLQDIKWVIKIHTTGISPLGYAMFRIEGGRESSRHHHLWELVEQIRSFGIKVKYEIGDGAYYP